MRALIARRTVSALMAVNEITERYGLTLTENQALALAEARDEALRANGRVELGGGILHKLALAFYDSPHISPDEYPDTLTTLTEIFYAFKHDTEGAMTDDDLIAAMRDAFDNACHGDLELLAGRDMERVSRAARRADYWLDDDVAGLEDEDDE